MYAQVIVDVPAKQTNRPFDYSVPHELREWVQVGCRVGVPFGPRTVQGFVIGLSDRTDANPAKLKPIGEVLDLMPPLTPELVGLAGWMSRAYICHEVTALQAMIPGALKAKYEKLVGIGQAGAEDRASESGHDPLQSSLEIAMDLTDPEESAVLDYVRSRGQVKTQTLLQKFPLHGPIIKRLLAQGRLSEEQTVKDRVGTKTALTVSPLLDGDELQQAMASLGASAKRQLDVLRHFEAAPEPIRLADLLAKLGISAGTVKSLHEKGWLDIQEVEVFRDPYAGRSFVPTAPLPLTPTQQAVFEPLSNALAADAHKVYLLQGVTGSGKTEVYMQAIRQCLDQGKDAIVLVPEISLTPQMVERFKGRFGNQVAVLHSRLSTGERYDEWRKIGLGQVRVAIGARSAVFAPFTKIGLIIIDEEHESSYKQEESPKYHARDVAVARARRHGAAVVLGSATPSLESYYKTQHPGEPYEGAFLEQGSPGAWAPLLGTEWPPFALLRMDARVEGRPLPEVHIVDLREELRGGNRSMFSRELYKAIEDRLHKEQQIVLLLNRRGYSTFVMCRSCGFVVQCPHCDIAMTYHQVSRSMRCHYCGRSESEPRTCPSCESEHIRYFGTGTQRVEEELGKLFPGIRVIRMDVDTTSEKGSHEKLLTRFRNRQADVLLGTQMVAKGLDFPDVTLVGVIAADTVLNLPDFRAAEKTFQLLTQVAGRAGRHKLPGEVYIQTYTPEHYSIRHASKHDYGSFLADELESRRERGYPPFNQLALVTFSHEQAQLLVQFGESFAAKLRELWARSPDRHKPGTLFELLGPIASPIPRIKDRYRFQCMIKYRGDLDAAGLIGAASDAFEERIRTSKIILGVDVNPQVLM
ncbi:primosomal protein N' [Paenibacillus koleovorans]|uniref:primosomal protein N' n=1 Tax=Paenibacillus koleovorans TaxID=121608 RepID=UPI000FD9AF7A|nr:primosomal protein N' [Paenibacillus koleovorans]